MAIDIVWGLFCSSVTRAVLGGEEEGKSPRDVITQINLHFSEECVKKPKRSLSDRANINKKSDPTGIKQCMSIT